MLQNERYDKIICRVNKDGAAKVNALAEELHASQSTVRRDIIELDNMGKLKKVFGGAVSQKGYIAVKPADMKTRAAANVLEKDSIARYAAALIADQDFVFIDAGTTTEKMIDFIPHTSATFVTNGVSHAMKLMQQGFTVYLPGGLIKNSAQSIIGPEAVAAIQKYNFTKCFMGANGIAPTHGFTTPDFEEALVKSEAVHRSATIYILADSSKFDRAAPVTFAELPQACIITDKLESKEYSKYTQIIETEADT